MNVRVRGRERGRERGGERGIVEVEKTWELIKREGEKERETDRQRKRDRHTKIGIKTHSYF